MKIERSLVIDEKIFYDPRELEEQILASAVTSLEEDLHKYIDINNCRPVGTGAQGLISYDVSLNVFTDRELKKLIHDEVVKKIKGILSSNYEIFIRECSDD